jgi:hypothetical protein
MSIPKEIQEEFIFNFTVNKLIKKFKTKYGIKTNNDYQFYEKYFGDLAERKCLPLEYFMNPFEKRKEDSKGEEYSRSQIRSAKIYYKLVFSSVEFKELFENYMNNELLEDYLMEIPYKIFCILDESFYFYKRDDDEPVQWNFPWKINEVESAIDHVNKSLF